MLWMLELARWAVPIRIRASGSSSSGSGSNRSGEVGDDEVEEGVGQDWRKVVGEGLLRIWAGMFVE